MPSCGSRMRLPISARTAPDRIAFGQASGRPQDTAVGLLQDTHQKGLFFLSTVVHKIHAHDGYEGEGEDQRADQGGHNGVGHRREDAAFMPLQGKNGQVSDDDDQHREERGAADLGGGIDHQLFEVGVAVPVVGSGAEDVLDHDDGAVDDNAEIHGAQRQQIRGNALDGEPNESRE